MIWILVAAGVGGYAGWRFGRRQGSAHIARGVREGACRATMDASDWYYLDVGCWQGGMDGNPKTTFGLISEGHVALCSWLNRVEGGMPVMAGGAGLNPQFLPLPSAMQSFFDRARNLSLPPPQRGAVVAVARSDGAPFTNPGSLILILPDFHLHAYVNQPVDRFRYKETPSSRSLQSLDRECRALLDVAAQVGAATVHVGDLYEVWEVELLARMQYYELLEGRRRFVNFSRGRDPLRSEIAELIRSGKVLVRDLRITHETFWRDLQQTEIPSDRIQRDGLAFTDTADICAKIRAAHRNLFGTRDRLCDFEVDGNHDNMLLNPYWSQIAVPDFRRNPEDTLGFLRRDTARARIRLREVNSQIGTSTHPIWIEHGHRYDWHNNDRDWWTRDHGFDTVYTFVSSWIAPIIGKRSASGGEGALAAADMYTDFEDYEMRLPALRRADEIIASQPNVRLVVMGHTHEPVLLHQPCRTALGPCNDGWTNYRAGDYWFRNPAPEASRAEWGEPRSS